MKSIKKPTTKKTRASRPPTPRPKKSAVEPVKSDSAELVVVYVSNGPYAAEIAKGRLESEGIEAMLKYETAESVFPMTVDTLGEVEVLVRAEDEEQARSILKTKKVAR